MELLDVYDKKFELIGKVTTRGDKNLKENEFIMLSIVFIKNMDNKFLIQKTSKQKGGFYSTTGGHVLHKENAVDAIKRELNEELGINVNKNEFKLLDKIILKDKPCIFNVFLLEKDINLNNIKLQTDEVNEIKYLSRNEIYELIEKKHFLESHGEIFRKIYYKKGVKYMSKWKCEVCEYIYYNDEHETNFEDLPEDWVCPECGASKDMFVKVD